MTSTRAQLVDATLKTLRDRGIAGTSARVIAAEAGVSQALVFYHFGTVDALVDAACREATDARVDLYREQFAAVGSLRELLGLGRRMHQQERKAGNVTVLAQVLAGAQNNEVLARAGKYAIELWVVEIERTMQRLLGSSPIAGAIDVPGLARAISAAFIGIELYDAVDPEGADAALAALDQLAVLIDVVEDLGPVARRALRSRMQRAAGPREHK